MPIHRRLGVAFASAASFPAFSSFVHDIENKQLLLMRRPSLSISPARRFHFSKTVAPSPDRIKVVCQLYTIANSDETTADPRGYPVSEWGARTRRLSGYGYKAPLKVKIRRWQMINLHFTHPQNTVSHIVSGFNRLGFGTHVRWTSCFRGWHQASIDADTNGKLRLYSAAVIEQGSQVQRGC